MRLDLVQAMRALAALMVAVHHTRHELAALGLAGGAAPALPWWAGVDVFFVISGFIMVHATGPAYDGPGGRARFLAHRIARVVPLYWLVTLAFAAIALAVPRVLGDGGAALTPESVAASLLFWPMARPDGSVLPLYGLGWTLNYEMFFYAVFALGLGRGRGATVALAGAALGGLVLAGLLAGPLPLPFGFWADPIVLEFLFGAGLGLLRGTGFRLGGAGRIALALAGVAALAMLATGEPGPLRPFLAGVPASLLVAAAALGRGEGARRPPAPLVAPLAVLGDASYALYLVHPFALRAIREGVARLGLGPTLGAAGTGALMLAASVAAALLVYRLVERPLTRRLRAVLDGTGRRKACAPPRAASFADGGSGLASPCPPQGGEGRPGTASPRDRDP